MEKFPTLVCVPSPVFPLADLVPVTPIVVTWWLGTSQLGLLVHITGTVIAKAQTTGL